MIINLHENGKFVLMPNNSPENAQIKFIRDLKGNDDLSVGFTSTEIKKMLDHWSGKKAQSKKKKNSKKSEIEKEPEK